MNRASNRPRWTNHIPVSVGAFAALLLLYFFAPAEHRFYPRCLFHSLTGWNCPFCGCLRATHQLLHGNFHNALMLNPLFVLVLLPVSLFVLAFKISATNAGRKDSSAVTPMLLWIWIGILAMFGILRNLSAFSWITP